MIQGYLRRIRAALALLFLPGDRIPLSRADLRRFEAEFQEWEMTMTGILEKLNAWYARQAKREKRMLERRFQEDGPPVQEPANRKLALYRKVSGGPPLGPIQLDHLEEGDDEP